MPFIHITVPTTMMPATKATLMRDVVDSAHQAIGSDPAIINVVVLELSQANVLVGVNPITAD